MKITKSQLKEIIKEELNEAYEDPERADASVLMIAQDLRAIYPSEDISLDERYEVAKIMLDIADSHLGHK